MVELLGKALSRLDPSPFSPPSEAMEKYNAFNKLTTQQLKESEWQLSEG